MKWELVETDSEESAEYLSNIRTFRAVVPGGWLYMVVNVKERWDSDDYAIDKSYLAETQIVSHSTTFVPNQ